MVHRKNISELRVDLSIKNHKSIRLFTRVSRIL